MMRKIALIFILGMRMLVAGTPEKARQLTRAYEQAYATWTEDVRSAPDNDAQNAAWLRRPDPLAAGKEIWAEIRDELSEAWSLDYSAWLLVNTPGAVLEASTGQVTPARQIQQSVEKFHLKSPKVGPYCIALTHVQDPRAMGMLAKIEEINPDQAVRGAAALGQAILHRRLGDEKHGMYHRQEKLRVAIKAPNLVVGRTTTEEILKDEIFRMTKLTVGTKAPNFRGVEITTKVSKLSDYQDQVVILFFWNALMPSHDQTLELMRRYQEEFEGKNVVILGVNMDNPLTLRRHIADGTVTWKNFSDSSQTLSKLYRIERWPYVYVLDQNQTIRYSGEPGSFVKVTAQDLLLNPPTKMAPAILEGDDGR